VTGAAGGAGSPDPAGEPELAMAAQRVLASDGHAYALQPWQVAYCFALVEGREPRVPPGCGVGKGWLDSRLREALDSNLSGDT
jgi:hypothetical protein